MISPFVINHDKKIILVDRGWVMRGATYNQLPHIPPVRGTITVFGRINFPQHNPLIIKNFEKVNLQWPLRVEELKISEITNLLKVELYPFLIVLEASSPYAFQTQFIITTMPPARHRGYAFQWFAMAATLFIITIVLLFK